MMLAQQVPPSLWFTLPLAALVIALYVYQGRRFIRSRRARRQMAQAGNAPPAPPQGVKQSPVFWFVSIGLGVALFVFLESRKGAPSAPATTSGSVRIWLALVPIALVAVMIGLFALQNRSINRVVYAAQARRAAGDASGGIAMLRDALAGVDPKRNPSRYAIFAVNLSNWLAEAGDAAASEAVLREGASRFPEDGTWTMAVAMAVSRAGRKEEAAELLERAIAQTPREAMIRVATAGVLADRGLDAQAAEHLRQAEELLAAYPTEQRSSAKDVAASIAEIRERAGDSPRGFEVVQRPAMGSTDGR